MRYYTCTNCIFGTFDLEIDLLTLILTMTLAYRKNNINAFCLKKTHIKMRYYTCSYNCFHGKSYFGTFHIEIFRNGLLNQNHIEKRYHTCSFLYFSKNHIFGHISVSVYYVAVRTNVLFRHWSNLARHVIIHDIIHGLINVPSTPCCEFFGVSPDGNCAYVH